MIMKRNIFFVLVVIVSFLTSCNFSEDLYINEDGSGRISINFDGSELMKVGGEELNLSEETIDSVISFKQLLEEKKDSISHLSAEEQARLKKLEKFNLHMVIDPQTNDMKVDMYTDFKKISELSDVFSAFQNAGAFSSNGGGATGNSMTLGTEATEVKYSLEKNTFKRIGTVKNQELLQQSVDSLGSVEMFLSSSTYTLNYHFPRKVKSVSVKGALFSEDRKTVIFKVPFMDYMQDPESLNIEVILENK